MSAAALLRRPWIALALIMTAGAALRAWHLAREALWGDEALTLILARWPLGDMIAMPTDNTPPLYYALHRLVGLETEALAAVRGLSLCFGVAAIGLVFLLGRRCFGTAGGLLAAALLAVWTPHVYYSQEARAYSLLFMLAVGSAAALAAYLAPAREAGEGRGRRRLALAAFCIASVAGFYTHVVFVFWLGLSFLILVGASWAPGPAARRGEVAIAVAACLAASVPGMLWFGWQASVHHFIWLEQAGPSSFAGGVADIMLPAGLWDNQAVRAAGALKAAKAGFILLFGLFAAIAAFKKRRDIADYALGRPVPAAIIAGFLALPLLVWLAGFVITPMFMPRTILFAAPGAILAAAGLVLSLRRPLRRAAAAAALIGVCGISSLLYLDVPRKEPWAEAAAYIEANASAGDVVVLCPHTKYPALQAALRSRLGAAGLVTWGRGLIRVGTGQGPGSGWRDSYYQLERRATLERIGGQGDRVRLVERTMPLDPGGTLWLVEAACRPDELRPVRRLLDGAGVRLVSGWRSGAADHPQSISVARYGAVRTIGLRYSASDR